MWLERECCSTGSTGARFSSVDGNSSAEGRAIPAVRLMRLGAVLAEAGGRNAIGSTASGSAECGEVVEKENRCRETGECPELDGPAMGWVTSFQAEGARTQTRLGLPRPDGPRLLGALPRAPARCADVLVPSKACGSMTWVNHRASTGR